MKLVRIVGEYKEGGEPNGLKAVLLCGLGDDERVVDGEWFGYVRYEDGREQPYIIRFGETYDFGGDPAEVWRTNIGTKVLRVGEYFTVSSEHGGPEAWEAACLITHITEIPFESSKALTSPRRKPAAGSAKVASGMKPHVATPREIEQVKKRLAKQAKIAGEKGRLAHIAVTYERKSADGRKKAEGQSTKAKQDIYRRGSRVSGSGYSKKG